MGLKYLPALNHCAIPQLKWHLVSFAFKKTKQNHQTPKPNNHPLTSSARFNLSDDLLMWISGTNPTSLSQKPFAGPKAFALLLPGAWSVPNLLLGLLSSAWLTEP